MKNHMNRLRFFTLTMVIIGYVVAPGLAQDTGTCPALVSDALAQVDSLCEETGRNQACYGNVTLIAEAQEGVESLKFETPGDIAKVADIQSLTLSPMDETAGEWGISLMKIQANLPDTLPGQNVTVVLFGDVAIKNAVGETSDTYTPMQAFYFRSGIGDSPCTEAPESGILIQTPKGAGKVEIVVNEVTIQLGSTAFLQAVPDDALYVNLLEGEATVTAFDKTKTVPAGMVVSVPIDENLTASGPPNEPYVAEAIETLSSVIALLPEAVTPTEPESTPEIEPIVDESGGCTVTAGGNINLRSGPGTVYAQVGGLAANDSATPTGQVMGVDGFTWWQLASGKWVRSDVVNATGDCESLPVMSDIPPTPTPAPAPVTTGGGGSNDFNISYCVGTQGRPIYAGQQVLFNKGCCGAATREEEEAFSVGLTGSIVVDGIALAIWSTGVWYAEGENFWSNELQGYWRATPGEHTVTGTWIGSGASVSETCTFVVE